MEIFQARFAAKKSANEPAGDCASDTRAVCLSIDPESQATAGARCCAKAKEEWASGIAAQLDQSKALADPQIAAVAGFVWDGEVRDNDRIVATGMPVWCTGYSPNSPFPTDLRGSDLALLWVAVRSTAATCSDRLDNWRTRTKG